MLPRDPHEPHRTATTLELFFDLVFVIAVATAAGELHHGISAGHPEAIVPYLMMFFAIWWAWMNFTWFATSFGTDDWLYRVMTFVQMGGVLVFASGIPGAFEHGDFAVPVIGYVIMRVALVAQWLRAARSGGPLRKTALIYASGISAVQLLWVGFIFVPYEFKPVVFLVLAIAEISVPVIAEVYRQTPWHPHHITERYGLFTIIVLGESLLGSFNAIIGAQADVDALGPLLWVALLTLTATAALWWIYFWAPHHREIGSFRSSLRYGYGHYFIFASAAAFSAGIEVEIDRLTDRTELSFVQTSYAVSIPLAIFLLSVWWIAIRPNADRTVNIAVPLAAFLVLLDPLLPIPATMITLMLVALVVVLVIHPPIERPEHDRHGSAARDGTHDAP